MGFRLFGGFVGFGLCFIVLVVGDGLVGWFVVYWLLDLFGDCWFIESALLIALVLVDLVCLRVLRFCGFNWCDWVFNSVVVI